MVGQKGFSALIILILAVVLSALGFIAYSYFQSSTNNNSNISNTTTNTDNISNQIKTETISKPSSRVGLAFAKIIKSVNAQVLGENTSKKSIPVQIYAYEDSNGNGVREPGEGPVSFMLVEIYDSPFSETPINKINSTDSGWASVITQVSSPYQLVAKPIASENYIPSTPSVILSEKNNFAVVGFQKKTEQSFHISVFAFTDTNKDGNYQYDDPNEKPLFLAPFTFYQQTKDGNWEETPNPINTTDTGWGTTTFTVKYPYKIKVVAQDKDNLTTSNKELVITDSNATLVFPYISK